MESGSGYVEAAKQRPGASGKAEADTENKDKHRTDSR